MNERIKELVEQSYVEVRGHGAFGESETYHQVDLEKFAELIIGECLSIYSAIDNGNKVEGTMNYGKAVYKRFGICK